ncbi:Kunitz/Bovine pancreatic trypsin inhibitor domain protein [Ancylostoma ceylanicum]|uniref:Kunitz/Bovine pancreatic trypsin inhibitor domain protein n=1 Tax=Ancylostoma ceylanicum TaxID=53326 RepID=A0A0D6LXT0_9BILA|nr:Kunitz/Bovine pancreatic trypsin inhibitor domain protein [Ancylostoma ceylanicum]
MIRTSAVLLAVLAAASAELPKELDAFLEVLFDVKECDSFLSGEFTTVATVDCAPYKCDFPRQVCMRPNSKYQEASANECRAVPMECLVAANGGEPVGPPQVMTVQPPAITMPIVINKPRKEHGGGGFVGGGNKVQPMTINPMDICQMGPPDGRFCGFKVMYTYNKETLQCDEFWFPGCTTADTNANLFIDMQSCEKLAEMCRPLGGPSPTIPSSGSGDGEDLGLLGLIQQGIQNANAIRQGGPQGKQAAAAAAGQILQQFTGFDLNNLGGNFGRMILATLGQAQRPNNAEK